MHLSAMSLAVPRLARHPNRLAFRGVLTLLDAPSDRPPAGARSHRVLLTRAAAERALPSLLGMGLDYAPSLDAHDARRKVGIITEAEVQLSVGSCQLPVEAAGGHGFSRAVQALKREAALAAGVSPTDNWPPTTANCIQIAGHLFARDFPDVVRELRARAGLLGLSYEIADARIADVRAAVWTLTDFTFTGAAILMRDRAAYQDTWFELEEESAVVGRQSAAEEESLVAGR